MMKKIMSRFEMNCPECGGHGYIDSTINSDYNEEKECPNCQGSGLIPNAEGLEILNFVRRYIND